SKMHGRYQKNRPVSHCADGTLERKLLCRLFPTVSRLSTPKRGDIAILLLETRHRSDQKCFMWKLLVAQASFDYCFRPMSKVRVLVGTRKGAFVLTSDGKRQRWQLNGPYFRGWEIFHVKGSPADPDRLYASQWSNWFGQLIQRSKDGGKRWEAVGNKFVYDGIPGKYQWFDGTPHTWEFKGVWHLEPSLTDPEVVYGGIEDAALFRSSDGEK